MIRHCFFIPALVPDALSLLRRRYACWRASLHTPGLMTVPRRCGESFRLDVSHFRHSYYRAASFWADNGLLGSMLASAFGLVKADLDAAVLFRPLDLDRSVALLHLVLLYSVVGFALIPRCLEHPQLLHFFLQTLPALKEFFIPRLQISNLSFGVLEL